MSRNNTCRDFIILINLSCASDVRRFCQVRVDKDDNVYVFQPRKGGSVKVSYHESGTRHLQIGDGPRIYGMQLDAPGEIRINEDVWSHSFDNFVNLLPYNGERADELCDITLPPVDNPALLTYAEISIGRTFDRTEWSLDGWTYTTIEQRVFEVPVSPSGISSYGRRI